MPANNAQSPIATAFRAAVMKYRIYPTTSVTVRQAIALLHQAVLELMLTREEVRLTRNEGKMFLDLEEIPQADAIAELYEAAGVQSLRFVKGFTIEEADALVACLARKRTDGSTFSEALSTAGVTHVETNDRTVVQLTEEQTVVGRGFFQFQDISAQQDVKSSVMSAIDYIDKIPEETHRQHLRQQLAVRMASLKSDVIMDLVEKGQFAEGGENSLKQPFLEAVSGGRMLEILNEVCRWAKKIERAADGSADNPERARLREFVSFLLKSPAAANVPRPIYEDLQKSRLIDAVPDTAAAVAVEEPLDVQADVLLQGNDAKFLQGLRGKGLAPFIERMLAVGLSDRVPTFIERISHLVREAETTLRTEAVQVAHPLQAILWENRLEEEAEKMNSALRAQADEERQSAVYKELRHALVHAALHDFRSKAFGPAERTLRLLRKHAETESPYLEGRRAEASAALQDILEELLDVLVDDLSSDAPERKAPAEKLLEHVGERGIRVFVALVRNSPNPRLRQWAAARLARYPEQGAAALAAELDIHNTSQVILNVTSVIPLLANPALVPGIGAMVFYPDPDVRRALVRVLQKLSGDDAMGIAERFLYDSDAGVRQTAIDVVGNYGWKRAIGRLLELLEDGPEAEMEAASIALGRLRAESAVEPLFRIVAGKTKAFGLGRKTSSDLLRARAAWALVQIGSTAAQQRLRTFREDPDPLIRQLANAAQTT
ncbi:MAG: HEAT repeat domain-containing protein [Elusimicrobia bacterium]|nr:HEAT repeat domain-containing protein [Elusimicrobiota bacterium]MBK9058202.1 HEAT repeat domain-containing protein [Elusimicrobiota bacterium]MBK9429923.1 HEAT repeat domain-containing protein [Elusimicrobiota bacterium]